SRRIEDLPALGGARLFGPDAAGRLARAKQTERMVQGLRDCVSIVLQDGRMLTCTPDHEILTADGHWRRADELKLGEDRVVVGLEAPLDVPGTDERGYAIVAGDLRLTMDSPDGRLRALAF